MVWEARDKAMQVKLSSWTTGDSEVNPVRVEPAKGKMTEIVSVVATLLLLFAPAILVVLPVFPRSIWLFVIVSVFCFASILLLVFEQYEIWASMLFGALTFFPAEAVGIISGYNYMLSSGLINISLAGYISMIMVIHAAVFAAYHKISFNIGLVSWALVTLAIIVGIRILADGLSGILSNKLFDTLFLPIAASLAIISLPRIDVRKVEHIFLGFLFINGVLACYEYLVGMNPILDWYYASSNQWYQQIVNASHWHVAYRSSALIGHPLTFAIYMNIGIMLSIKTLSRKGLKIAFVIVFICALLTTNSRGGLLVLLIMLIYFSYKKGTGYMLLALLFIALGVVFFGPSVYASFFSRDATGSSLLARSTGLSAVFSASPIQLLLGVGFRGSQSIVSSYADTQSNIEIGPVVLLVQIGFFSFVALAIYCYKLLISGGKAPARVGSYDTSTLQALNLSIAVFLVEACTYNSIGDPGQLMYLLFSMLALRSCLIRQWVFAN